MVRQDVGSLLFSAGLATVAILGWGCGGASGGTAPPAEPSPPRAPAIEEPSPLAAEAGEDALEPEPIRWLRDLNLRERLVYRVRTTSGEELNVQMRILEVVERGPATAVHLSPVGVPLSESTPVYPHWLVGTVNGLYALQEHVSLTEPGFVPLDEDGELVTEARNNVAWHIPPRWFRPAAGAFETDTEQGWHLAGHQERIEGTVRGDHCVRLERADGELHTRMVVCANTGMMEMQATGTAATEEIEQFWRLVDLGAPTELALDDDAPTARH